MHTQYFNYLRLICMSFILISVSSFHAIDAAEPEGNDVSTGVVDPGWPRQHIQDGNILIIYQPQVDDWKHFTELEWRMAFSLTPTNEKAVVGVVVLKGVTDIDHENKTVLISNLKITNTHFPSLEAAKAAQMDQLLRRFLPPAVEISLHRLVACVPKKESAPGVQLKNDPPVIYVSYKPSILLDVDGPPVRAPIEKTDLEYVVNTHWPLFCQKSKVRIIGKSKEMYYLLAGEIWLQASKLDGPWSLAKKLPKDMEKVIKESHWKDLKEFVPPPPAKSDTMIPTVYYSTKPAEVILFNGQPEYEQIPGTKLVYAKNTLNYLFFHTPTKHYYFLTAGRWFSAKNIEGPWTFATSTLPADFSQIPPGNPAGQVLASVPGTEEAKDAVLLAQIPTTVVVNPTTAAAQAKVIYQGKPNFVIIEGTTMLYATNTEQKVIKVGDLYYLCLQGVWFVSTTPQGPWQTAQSVPQQIYTIPPSSPVYNITYVTQTTTSDGKVQSSYTAGYMGAFIMGVATGAVIAGGSGYDYPPYVVYPVRGYPVYYPRPYTYGARSYYHSTTGAYGVSQTAYGPYGSATRAAAYNPYTGTRARGASVSTAYGTTSAGRAYNPYTGASAATRQHSNAYASWGSSMVSKGGESAYTRHYSSERGSAGSVHTSSGGRAYGVKTDYGSTAVGKTASGDMYAGHDGNVYKNTGSGWQKYDDGSWSDVQTPSQSAQQQAQQRAQSAQGQAQQRAQSGQQQAQQRAQSGQQQAQQRAQSARQSSGASSRRASSQQQAHQRSSPFGHQRGGGQMHGLQRESKNRQRGSHSSQRFQSFQRSRGSSFGGRSGGSRGGGRSRGGRR